MNMESDKRNFQYSFDEKDGTFQVAFIEDDSKDIREADRNFRNPTSKETKRQKKTATEEDHTSEDEQCETISDQVPMEEDRQVEEKRKEKSGQKKITAQNKFTSGEDERYESVSDDASKKVSEKRKKEIRGEHASGFVPGEDRRHKHQKNGAGKEKNYSAREPNYQSKSRFDGGHRHADSPGVDSRTLSDEAVTDFVVAENQGSVKHILILGTIGSGKYTIAKNISTNPYNFPSRNSLRESGIIQYVTDGDLCKFILVDTGGARMPDVWGDKGPTIGSIAAEIKKEFRGGISLIIVVVRYDRDTPEDLQVLVNLINGLFTDEAKQHITLIHSGCETLSEENISQYLEHFKQSGPSRQLSSLCRKGIVTTGFPNIKKAKSEMVEYFQETIEESKRKLSALVESCRFFQPYSKILKAKDDPTRVFPDTKPDCCVM